MVIGGPLPPRRYRRKKLKAVIVRIYAQAIVESGVGLIGRWVGTAVPSILPVIVQQPG